MFWHDGHFRRGVGNCCSNCLLAQLSMDADAKASQSQRFHGQHRPEALVAGTPRVHLVTRQREHNLKIRNSSLAPSNLRASQTFLYRAQSLELHRDKQHKPDHSWHRPAHAATPPNPLQKLVQCTVSTIFVRHTPPGTMVIRIGPIFSSGAVFTTPRQNRGGTERSRYCLEVYVVVNKTKLATSPPCPSITSWLGSGGQVCFDGHQASDLKGKVIVMRFLS